MITVSIARDGVEIGDHDLHAVAMGHEHGRFLDSDLFWHEGITAWKPLTLLMVAYGQAFGHRNKFDPSVVLKGPATERQIEFLSELGDSDIPVGLTKQEASHKIEAALVSKEEAEYLHLVKMPDYPECQEPDEGFLMVCCNYEVSGPFSYEDIKGTIQEGELTRKDFYFDYESFEWRRLGTNPNVVDEVLDEDF